MLALSSLHSVAEAANTIGACNDDCGECDLWTVCSRQNTHMAKHNCKQDLGSHVVIAAAVVIVLSSE